LSGGQKQRLSIARSVYSNTDIQIFDVNSFFDFIPLGTHWFSRQDPLSALDAHVGKAVFQNVLHDHSTGKTRVLVTHALHFLPQVDFIYTIVEGHIAEQGTYSELMSNDGAFSKFIKEFGSKEEQDEKEEEEAVDDAADEKKPEAHKHETHGPGMMQVEERNTGAISREIYKEYLGAGKGPILVPLLLFSLVLIQATTVMSSYWFVASFLIF
jgi:ABC-type methionine transport system ATPase subunit